MVKVIHYHILKLSKFVAILKAISESRASVIKDDTELLVKWSHAFTSALGCNTYICSLPADIVLVVKPTTFVS